ncbi:MAG: response regulator, partial [Candidatus Omnitrophota bacterium]
IDLLKKIRETDKETRIYIITGYADEYKYQAMGAGADKYVEKPLNLQKINNIIEDIKNRG